MMTALKMGDHVVERNFEEYCLGRVLGPDLEEFEDHVLVCSHCQVRLQETDLYIRAMRLAMVDLAREEAERDEARRSSLFGRALHWITLPVPMGVLAGVSALALLLGLSPLLNLSSPSRPITVTLDSARGGDAELTARAPEGQPLVLSLDLTGLSLAAAYQVRIVDAKGAPVSEALGTSNQGRLLVTLKSRLPRGAYWVRLYDQSDPQASVREYGLRLQ